MASLSQLLLSARVGERIYTEQSDRAVHTTADRVGVGVSTQRHVAVPLAIGPDKDVVTVRRITVVTIISEASK